MNTIENHQISSHICHAPVLFDNIAVAHVITGLPVGGAQTMLAEIVRRQRQAGDQILVISLTELGSVGENLQRDGIQVFALEMNRSRPSPRDLMRLRRIIKKFAPDVVQTWMYHADLIGGLAAKLAGNIPVVWNIRHSDLRPSINKLTTIWTARLCSHLSRWLPEVILCNSYHAADLHQKMGYARQRVKVLPNGIDMEKFRPRPEAGAWVRSKLGISDEASLVGLVARFDPQKDHRRFIAAAEIVAGQHADAHFLLCGSGIDAQNQNLARWINDTTIAERFHLLGVRDDVPRLTAALDLSVSSSAHGEGFSNIIAEAMACAVPCVVTEIGDSALIVGDTGWSVPAENEVALADAISVALSEPMDAHKLRGEQARSRIRDNFSIDEIFAKYRAVYQRLRQT